MRSYCLVLLFPIIFLGILSARGQNPDHVKLDSFSGSFIKNMRIADREKAYLVTNKSIYTSGESLWFRAYLLHALSNKVSVLSKYLFVDLINEKENVILKSLLNAKNQQINGKLVLPDTLATGYYWLRAYTSSMIWADSNNAAVVPLYIMNPANPVGYSLDEKRSINSVNEPPPILEIFPEGGSLVTGINTGVGFYAHDPKGNPLELTVTIKDNRDSMVSSCTTSSLGLSKAEFFPYFYRKYRAVISFHDKEYNFPFPSFNRFAGQLSAIMEKGILKLRTVLEDSIFRNDAVTYVMGISRDSLCFAGIGYGSYETFIPTSKFPRGIATFFLFDKNFMLLSERSVYIKEENVVVKAAFDKPAYNKRSKAFLSASVLTNGNLPVQTSLTIDIADSNALVTNDALSAASLLRSAMYGNINDWNLAHLTTVSDRDIDILMLCKPSFYRGLKKESLKMNDPIYDTIFYIKGRVVDLKGQALPDKILNLIYKAEETFYDTDTTDKAGNFSFALSGYADSTQFVIQMSDMKGNAETPRIVFEKFSFPHFQTPLHLKKHLEITSSAKVAYSRHHIDTTVMGNSDEWLKPVQINTKSKNFYEHSGRLSASSSVLTSDQLMKLGMGNIGIGILRLPGVQLNNGFVSMYGPDDMNGINASSEPMVLLDGIQMTLTSATGGAVSSPVIQFLNSLDPREIEFIEVIKGSEASLYGLRGGKGVIYIHSSTDIKQDFVSDNVGVFKFYRQGFAKPVFFPQISYDQKNSKDFSFTDARSALYWNGNELTDSKGNSTFTFFTNDIPGRYKVVITGVTVHGDLIYQTFSFPNL